MGIWDAVHGSSLGREGSRDVQQQSTSPCQGAHKGSRHSQRREVVLRAKYHVAPTQANFSFCIKQKRQLLPLANIAWCPQKGLPLLSTHLTPGSLLAGQRAVLSAADKAFSASRSLSSLWKPAELVNREKRSNILRK